MAALLESLLARKVDLCKVLDWLKNVQDSDRLAFNNPELTIHKQEFIPFLLNFLRDQSSQALTHGPATPAKTPTRPRPATSSQGFAEKRGCRSAGGGGGSRGASRVQLFSYSVSPGSESGPNQVSSPSFSATCSPASRSSGSERRPSQRISLGDYVVSSPEVPKSRRRSGNGAGRHVGGGRATHHLDDSSSRTSRGAAFSGTSEQVSPPSPGQLNFNNLEDFPPVGSSSVTPVGSKPSRRINPTPVSAERSHSKPKTCFTSTPFAKAPSPAPPGEALESPDRSATALSPRGLMEERELLKREKSKRAQQTFSPPPASAEPRTPTKSAVRAVGSKVTPDRQTPCPEPSQVTAASDLDILAELYCACISENLVPNIFLELFFVMQLLTSRSPNTSDNNDDDDDEEGEAGSVCVRNSDVLERHYLKQVHNCVYFAVKVLENQYQLLAHLDKCTLRLLAENERVASFSPGLRDRLSQAQDRSAARLSPCGSTFIHSVPFQPATDNRFNFSSDKAFHTFKKQRDIFYEVLREWEDFHKEPGWNFDVALGSRIRGMMSQLTAAGSHSHFARLFLKQLVQMCKGPRVNGSSGDAPDADLLGMMGADGLGRLKRLEERLIQPRGVGGPCPPPSFPGHQEFFRDFLQAASCCQLNQHLQDSLCQQLLQLDEVSILSPPAPVGERGHEAEEEGGDGDMEQQDEKQRFASVLLLARLLAKFLGFISFLPYQTAEKPSREIREAAVALRSKSVPVLDVCGVLRNSVRRRRTILTVPWLVEFLSMLDFTGPLLLGYRVVLGTLCLLYRKMILSRCGETSYLNKLLLVSVLGWLFQIPVIPEEVFFTSDFTEVAELEESNPNAAGLDCIPLVDQQLLYTCCPFLGEFRKLLAAFVSGSSAKGGGVVRKITPTSAEPRDAPGGGERSRRKLLADLEQAFFHNQPPSLRRTVEFVAERVGSNAVKHMKATLVSELVERGEKMLRDGLESPKANPPKLNESICAQLCEAGLDSLTRAARFCCEKSPEAVRILLPVETSPAVLATSENITIHLATEKACSWLSANIAALIRREWKCRYERVIKTLTADSLEEPGPPLTPRRKPGGARVTSCPPSCAHDASLPSDVLIAIKDLLSVAAGPRADEELPSGALLQTLFRTARDTLVCKKFLTAVSEQMLLNASVLLACKLVSGELPLAPRSGAADPEPCVRALLEQLAELWERDNCCCAPLHLLFTPLTVTAVLEAGDGEWNNFLYVVRRLVDRGLLSEEELVSHWTKLAKQIVPVELMEKFEHNKVSSSLPIQMNLLQLSKRTLEGAT
ncbi:codanin-1 isoform X2 [Syngnathoides biaculeatus]|uniref:codanin-1 isoform X2 n=1 Tax=Syngnathoides biaculeatus TaxID=300417 RepID=UPI002ADD5A4D|nr:codanin-1 isoform X2 [Syngnathoides biaculeatus]